MGQHSSWSRISMAGAARSAGIAAATWPRGRAKAATVGGAPRRRAGGSARPLCHRLRAERHISGGISDDLIGRATGFTPAEINRRAVAAITMPIALKVDTTAAAVAAGRRNLVGALTQSALDRKPVVAKADLLTAGALTDDA